MLAFGRIKLIQLQLCMAYKLQFGIFLKLDLN